MSVMSAQLKRVAAAGAVAASAVLVLSAPAFAHVSVQPQGEAAKGGFATVNFKVPNERDDASTTKLEVNFPTDTPLTSVLPEPVPGWDLEVTRSTLDKPVEMHGEKIDKAVSKVTWTADEDGIEPGTFQQFPVSIGALPESDQLVFKALQTYSDKEVVRWIEEPEEGAAEPESPAPVLKLTEAAEGHGAAAADKASDDAKSGARGDNAEQAADSNSDGLARGLGIAGILAGVAGVAFGVLAGRRRGESAS